jgi:PEP-CTERM motif
MKKLLAVAALSLPVLASAQIANPGFETGDFTGWTVSQGNFPSKSEPASIISTPGAVYGEAVPAAPAGGSFALYFVQDGDAQTVSQTTNLAAGLYDWSVSWYLPANGLANPADAHLHLSLGGNVVWTEHITAGDAAQSWVTVSGQAALPANFAVAFSFSSDGSAGVAAKDIVVDNITVTAVPEPESFALMAAGLAAVGFLARRRRV